MAQNIYAEDATLADHYQHWLSLTGFDSLAQEQIRWTLRIPEWMQFAHVGGKVVIKTSRGLFDLAFFPVKVERQPRAPVVFQADPALTPVQLAAFEWDKLLEPEPEPASEPEPEPVAETEKPPPIDEEAQTAAQRERAKAARTERALAASARSAELRNAEAQDQKVRIKAALDAAKSPLTNKALSKKLDIPLTTLERRLENLELSSHQRRKLTKSTR
jgi:hypothetical protein